MKKPKKLKKLIEHDSDHFHFEDEVICDDLNPQELEDLDGDHTKELGEDLYHFKDAISEEDNGQ